MLKDSQLKQIINGKKNPLIFPKSSKEKDELGSHNLEIACISEYLNLLDKKSFDITGLPIL